MPSPNFKNLTPEERAEYGRKGGKKAAKTRKRKKAMRETLEILLSMPMKRGKIADVEEIKSFGDLKGKNVDIETAMLVAMLQKALRGDITAATFIRDTSGQKPQEEINMTGSIPVVISGETDLKD